MRVPAVAVEPCDILSYRDGRPPVQRRMGPMRIVEVLEGHQFVFQVRRRPEQQLIHAFSSQRADQPFDKRMLRRPRFSWTRIKGESDVQGGRGNGSVEEGEGTWVGSTGVRADAAAAGSGALAPGQRWSASRKRDVVLWLLRGESLDAVSRAVGVELYRLEAWKARALACGWRIRKNSIYRSIFMSREPEPSAKFSRWRA